MRGCGHASSRCSRRSAPAPGFSLAAHAQTQLPGITVTTPSPVTPKPAAGPPPATAPQPTAPAPDPLAGTGLSISPDQGFAAVTVMTPDQLLSRPGATLGDALGTQPGIATTTFAPGASRPVIRGLSGFRVRIQENGLATGDVSALSDDHAVPIDPLAAGQVEVVRGPATLRYGSQAIGGVVNAINNRIPTAIPTNGILVETRGGFSTVDDGRNGAAIVEAGAGNFVVHADTFARSAGDYGIPGGTQANTSLDSEGYSLGGSFVCKDGFIGIAYSSFDSTYYIPGIEAAASKNHIVLNQTKLSSRGEWRVNDFGLEAIRFWFGATDYKHDEVDSLPVTVIGSTFLQTTYETRMEAQHLPVNTALGVLRGAVGMQWSDRDLQAAGADGILLNPTNQQSLAGFVFEELQLTKRLRLQAAARIEGDDVTGTASTFPPSFLPPPDDPTQSAARRSFAPKSVSAGIALRSAARRRRAGDGGARGARARCHRAVLQGAARLHGHLRDRQSQPHDRGRQHLRDRLEAGQGRLPLRPVGLPHQFHQLHLQALHRRQVRQRFCLLRHGHGARPDRLLAAGRHLHRPGAADRVRRRPHLARRVWASRGNTTSCTPSSPTARTCPRCRRIGWVAASTIATPTGSRA